MSFLGKVKQAIIGSQNLTRDEIEHFFPGTYEVGNYRSQSDLAETTYFTCIKILSESVGKLSLHLLDSNNQKIYEHDSVECLQSRPNSFMTPAIFKQVLEFRRNHYGNAYVYCERKGGRLQSLIPLDSRQVRVLVDNSNMLTDVRYVYEYTGNNGKSILLHPDDVLHFKGGLSENGLVGKSVRETLASTLESAKASEAYLNKLYKEGLTANAVLKYTGDLSQQKKKELVSELAKFGNASSSDRIIPIPFGFDLQPLNIKLTDSQFAELKKFNALQIAAAFGVKPNQLNDYEKASYSNSEMQNLTFYIDTLLYNLRLYEEEFNYKLLKEEDRKLGYHWEFNVATILRGDLKSQAEALTRYVAGTIYTPNEARAKVGLPPVEGGDELMANGSYVGISDLGAAYLDDINNKSEGGDD